MSWQACCCLQVGLGQTKRPAKCPTQLYHFNLFFSFLHFPFFCFSIQSQLIFVDVDHKRKTNLEPIVTGACKPLYHKQAKFVQKVLNNIIVQGEFVKQIPLDQIYYIHRHYLGHFNCLERGVAALLPYPSSQS